jgi:hypothetical protein
MLSRIIAVQGPHMLMPKEICAMPEKFITDCHSNDYTELKTIWIEFE